MVCSGAIFVGQGPDVEADNYIDKFIENLAPICLNLFENGAVSIEDIMAMPVFFFRRFVEKSYKLKEKLKEEAEKTYRKTEKQHVPKIPNKPGKLAR